MRTALDVLYRTGKTHTLYHVNTPIQNKTNSLEQGDPARIDPLVDRVFFPLFLLRGLRGQLAKP